MSEDANRERKLTEWQCPANADMSNVRGRVRLATKHNQSNRPTASDDVADDFKGFMASSPISELANWDGRLSQKKRQNSKWPRSSSIHARDPYQPSLDLEVSQLSTTVSIEKKRAEKSFFRPNLGRTSMANTLHARLPSRINTTSTPLLDTHDDHRHSISTPRPSSTLSISPLSSPIFSELSSRVNNSRIHLSSRQVVSSASTLESEVIDLTLEDTEDGVSLSKESVPITTRLNKRSARRTSRRQSSSSAPSSPILPEQSLFTPPPPSRRRARQFVDYLLVPPLPDGLTKADYQPVSHYRDMLPPGSAVSSMPNPAAPVKPPSPLASNGNHESHKPVIADLTPSELLDAFYEPIEVPLYDDDTYPPLTTWELGINTRFQFARAWQADASKLREPKPDQTHNLRTPGKAFVWTRPSETSLPRVFGTTGYVSIECLRPWELVPPAEVPAHPRDEQACSGETPAVVDAIPSHTLLSDDALPGPSTAVDSALSNPSVSRPYSSVAVDTETDMNQFFNGLGDSPDKNIHSGQQLAPTNAFRSHLLHSTGRVDTNSFDYGSPPPALDPRLADTSGHECFLGVPPSPTAADMVAPAAPGPAADSPFENHITASPIHVFTENDPFADVWTFEQGEPLPIDDKSPPVPAVPSAAGTINPSLLGPEQSKTSSAELKRTKKRRSGLPEPVIYIRRPVDPSSLPVIPGKRPVQIKYRDQGASSASSVQKLSHEPSSNHAENPAGLSTSDLDEFVPLKRRPVASRKLREAYAPSESDSDFIPDTTRSESKLGTKRRNLEERESVAEPQDSEAETVPTMSYCHQCRNKSVRPKMSCSNVVEGRLCGKRFCNRCILFRYPDVTFDEHSAGFLCPVCTNTCNCSYCSRNRGEEFISMKLGGLAASIFKSKVTLVRDASANSLAKDTQLGTSATQVGEQQSKFWAHVYGMEGQRVGSAFMTQAQMDRLHAPSGPTSVSAPPALQLPSQPRQHARKPRRQKKPSKPTGPRVFIGRPLPSWKIRAVRDLESSAGMDADAEITSKGKGRATGCRWYVGNVAALFEPYGRMPSGMASPTSASSRASTPGPRSNGTLTPLSELAADDWPQPGVGECCEWAPRGVSAGLGTHDGTSVARDPSSFIAGQGLDRGAPEAITDPTHADEGSPSTTLSEKDLARAISAALAALVEPPGCPC